jgi:hypothetical protein
MSDVWFTVGVPATVAVATALYTTGGRAALARRAISQELEIAKMLPEGHGREGVERMAEEKAVLYASRWVGPQPLVAREHLVLLGTAIGGGVLTWLAATMLDNTAGHPWWTSALLLVMFVGMAAAALGTTAWLSLMFMADNAKTRSLTIKTRRERLERRLRRPSATEEAVSS